MKNSLKRLIHSGGERRENDPANRELLQHWLERGYDKLNIGGGSKNLKGFVNIDFVFFPAVSRQIVANILDLSFVPTASMSHLHSNHVVEHLTADQLRQQLGEYYRILKPDGRLTLRCPNALGAAYGFWFDAVLEQDRNTFVDLGFPADEDFGNPADRWVEKDFYGLVHWFYGDVGNIQNQHLSRLTPSVVRNNLHEAGFHIVKMSDPESLNIVVVAGKA